MAATHQSRRWYLRIFSRKVSPPLDPSRADLEIVAEGFDDVESCSTALERGASAPPRWRPDSEAVLRHHLDLPEAALGEAESIVAQDGYRRSVTAADSASSDGNGVVRVVFERVQLLDALHCSQERSRMAGLAQRLGGSVAGWDALQPGDAAQSGPGKGRRSV
ncbi:MULTISPECIES: hypothetical protein [Rhodococcus]|uniref:hypothetical protein n=1 Tax=Rhodococcus TaxID=1827 RepID=UPI000AB0EE44|nr:MULTISPECIES: hypothetical protein [Rhodococcus]